MCVWAPDHNVVITWFRVEKSKITFLTHLCTFMSSVTLGYLRYYPKEFVNAWSSGTGFAGILGAALYIMFSKRQTVFIFHLLC